MATQVISPIDGHKLGVVNRRGHTIKSTEGTPIPDAEHNTKVIDLARWAIDEYNKEIGKPEAFKFRQVDNASYAECDMMYYIKLEAWTGCLGRVCEAKVWEQPWTNSKKLVEFKQLN